MTDISAHNHLCGYTRERHRWEVPLTIAGDLSDLPSALAEGIDETRGNVKTVQAHDEDFDIRFGCAPWHCMEVPFWYL